MSDIERRRADRWNLVFITGMWFQDLFNYDFPRTEMCSKRQVMEALYRREVLKEQPTLQIQGLGRAQNRTELLPGAARLAT